MVGGYIIFDKKLHTKIINATLNGETRVDYPGAYKYFKELYDIKKLIIVPRSEAANVSTNAFAFMLTVEELGYQLFDAATAVRYGTSVSSPDTIEIVQE